MPRAVSPWTWGKALRDHGPNDRDFLCAMLILRTYMDQDGFAFPSLRTWATGARMSVNTLRKHVEAASAAGWLNVESRAGQRRERVRHVYRCTIPDHVCIDSTDDKIAEAIEARTGDVDGGLSRRHPVRLTERVPEPFEAEGLADTHLREGPSQIPALSAGQHRARNVPGTGKAAQGTRENPGTRLDPRVSRKVDTDHQMSGASVSRKVDTERSAESATSPSETSRIPADAESVSNAPPICVKAASDLYQNQGASVSPMGDTEVLKSTDRSSCEGAARTLRPRNDEHREDEQTRRQKARKLLEAAPTTDDTRIASMYRLTLDQVASIRAELAECT